MNARTQLNQPRQQCLPILEVIEGLTHTLEALLTNHHYHHLEDLQTIRTDVRTLILAVRWHPEPETDND